MSGLLFPRDRLWRSTSYALVTSVRGLEAGVNLTPSGCGRPLHQRPSGDLSRSLLSPSCPSPPPLPLPSPPLPCRGPSLLRVVARAIRSSAAFSLTSLRLGNPTWMTVRSSDRSAWKWKWKWKCGAAGRGGRVKGRGPLQLGVGGAQGNGETITVRPWSDVHSQRHGQGQGRGRGSGSLIPAGRPGSRARGAAKEYSRN